MKTLFRCLLCSALLALWPWPAPAQTPVAVKVQALSGVPTSVPANTTTNCAVTPPVDVFRGRGFSVWFKGATAASVDADSFVITWQVSTNKAGDAATNWYLPYPPITTTFTNNGAVAAVAQCAFVWPTSLDNVRSVSPYSIANTVTSGASNYWTNVSVKIGVSP